MAKIKPQFLCDFIWKKWNSRPQSPRALQVYWLCRNHYGELRRDTDAEGYWGMQSCKVKITRPYLTPAANPSPSRGILIRIGSASPFSCASKAAARIDVPVPTIRVLSCDSATQAPGGASLRTILRSRGRALFTGFFVSGI